MDCFYRSQLAASKHWRQWNTQVSHWEVKLSYQLWNVHKLTVWNVSEPESRAINMCVSEDYGWWVAAVDCTQRRGPHLTVVELRPWSAGDTAELDAAACQQQYAKCTLTNARTISGVARIGCEGGTKLHRNCLIILSYTCMMTRNNTMNNIHVAVTELQQLLK